MSFNIFHDNNWDRRKDLVVATIASESPDVVGLQEALIWQLEYLVNELPEFAFVGAGRDDGRRAGETVGVLYRKDRFKLLASGHFWFSDEPEEPGSIPGASWGSPTLPRLATWLRLAEQATGREFLFFNVHLQHEAGTDPTLTRFASVELLLQRIGDLGVGAPVVVVGDFNAIETDAPIRRMTGAYPIDYCPASGAAPCRNTANSNPFVDAFRMVHGAADQGTRCFDSDDAGRRIDYIFVSQDVDVREFRIGEKQNGICASDHHAIYARIIVGQQAPGTAEPAVPEWSPGDTEFLDDISRRTFAWFWESTEKIKGLTPVREPRVQGASIAAMGGALTAWGIGAERGYISRSQATERTLATLEFLYSAPQGDEERGNAGYRGVFYHLLNMDDGLRHKSIELSIMDTALLMAGVLFSQSYFDRPNDEEARIRHLAEALYRRVEWRWFLRDHSPLLTMSWQPGERGFSRSAYKGLNEAMILYLLALGSPTYAVDVDSWDAYSESYVWGDFYGFEHLQFSPLFGHQYSHMWIDFRGIADAYMREKGIDYFENSRRATLAQKEYALDNPGRFDGYGENLWGLTASDGPANATAILDGREIRFRRYWARGASLRYIKDDGTIAPTAIGGSIPFAPRETVPVLREIVERYGDRIYNEHGFLDAFNLTFARTDLTPGHGTTDDAGWFDDQHLGISQAPILIMIENHRSGLVWDVMKKNRHLVRGLCRAGFTGGWLDGRCE